MAESVDNITWACDETLAPSNSSLSISDLYELNSESQSSMEVTGFAIGVVSLIGPLASACISGYELLKGASASAIDEDAGEFQLEVDTQMGLLAMWIKSWVHFDENVTPDALTGNAPGGSSKGVGKLRSRATVALGENGCVIVFRTLAKISQTLADTRSLQSSYGIYLSPPATAPPLPNSQGPTASGSGSVASTSSSGPSSSNSQAIQLQPTGPATPDSSKKPISPTVVPVSSSSPPSSPSSPSATQSTAAVVVNPRNDTGIWSWFSRAGCLKLCDRKQKYSGPPPRKSTSNPPKGKTKVSANAQASSSPTATQGDTVLNLDIHTININENLAALVATQTEILENLSRVQRLRWVLKDREKAMGLARQLRHYIDNLFGLLPLKRIETPRTPVQIKARKHYNLPRSSPIFTGRTKALGALEREFLSQEAKPRRRQAVLYGLGGAGKTQIAIKFAEENREKFDAIFWIDASSDLTVEESFKKIADALAVSGAHLTEMVLYRLASLYDFNYLLIFDNADNLPNIPNYFPGGYHGNILVTSRDSQMRNITEFDHQTLEIDKMEQEEAYNLLVKAARMTPAQMADPDTKSSAELIVQELGYLALAIDQAGAYIANSGKMKEYLGVYRKKRPDMLNSKENVKKYGYAVSVYRTWELSYEKVQHKNPAAAELLLVLGYYNFNAIPREIFEIGGRVFARASTADPAAANAMSPFAKLLAGCISISDPNDPQDPNEPSWIPWLFDQAVATLLSYSLIKRDMIEDQDHSPTYTIHPLVHCWIRDRNQPDIERLHLQNMAIALLQETMLTKETEGGYALRSRLVSHLDAWVMPYLDGEAQLQGHGEEERIGVLEAAALTYQDSSGRLDDAERLREKVLNWRIHNLGSLEPETILARFYLGTTYRRQSKLQKALRLHQETLNLLRKFRGPEHPDTLEAMLDLAWTYAEQGNISEAEQLEREVVAVRTKVLGADHIDTAFVRGSLGMTLWRAKRYEEAKEEFSFSLEKTLAKWGPRHPKTLLNMGNLASALRGLKRYASAEKLNRQVIEIRKGMFGPEQRHRDIARSMAHLGVTLLEAGRPEEARTIEEDALVMMREMVGDYHMWTLDTVNNLVRVYIDLNMLKEAEEKLLFCIEKRKFILGETHPVTLEDMKMLAKLPGHEHVLDEVAALEARAEKDKKELEAMEATTATEDGPGEPDQEENEKAQEERSQRAKARDEMKAKGILLDRTMV